MSDDGRAVAELALFTDDVEGLKRFYGELLGAPPLADVAGRSDFRRRRCEDPRP